MTDAMAGKWDFADDEARHDAIMEEAEINAQAARDVAETNKDAAVDAAEAANTGWPWIAFWLGLFTFLTVNAIYRG